jgi:hypothetical protein
MYSPSGRSLSENFHYRLGVQCKVVGLPLLTTVHASLVSRVRHLVLKIIYSTVFNQLLYCTVLYVHHHV